MVGRRAGRRLWVPQRWAGGRGAICGCPGADFRKSCYIAARSIAQFVFFFVLMVVLPIQPLRAAEAGASASGGGGDAAPRKPVKTGLIPEADAKLADLAVFVATQWQGHAWLTLRYTTAGDFLSTATAYKKAVADRVSAGAERPESKAQIQVLDAQINEHLYRVKGMLTDKYDKKQAPAYFAKMGIVKEADSYILPRERSKRSGALAQLIKGLTDEGFVTQTLPGGQMVFAYGTAFWQPIATQYAQALADLTQDTSDISEAVGGKDTLREEVETVLRSLAKVLEGNYPVGKEYKAQLRAFGYQRESY